MTKKKTQTAPAVLSLEAMTARMAAQLQAKADKVKAVQPEVDVSTDNGFLHIALPFDYNGTISGDGEELKNMTIASSRGPIKTKDQHGHEVYVSVNVWREPATQEKAAFYQARASLLTAACSA